MAKMWDARFSKVENKRVNDFNSSISFDCRMFREDIEGSIAHATMLGKQGIIPADDCEKIVTALAQIKSVEKGRLLEEDILAMKEYFQTDIEEVSDYEIRDIEITNADENLVCAVVSVDWEVSGTAGKEKITEIYSVIMEKDEKSYKLVQFF